MKAQGVSLKYPMLRERAARAWRRGRCSANSYREAGPCSSVCGSAKNSAGVTRGGI